MKITTPHGTLEGDNIEAILKEHGFNCLHGADLHGADLRGAYLRDADLCDADLCDADLYGADLRDANLRDANLSDANHVKLSIAKISILPNEGDIIGWKKAWTDNEMPRQHRSSFLTLVDTACSASTSGKAHPSSKRTEKKTSTLYEIPESKLAAFIQWASDVHGQSR